MRHVIRWLFLGWICSTASARESTTAVATRDSSGTTVELSGLMEHVIRVDSAGVAHCATEATDPVKAALRAAGFRDDGARAHPFSMSKGTPVLIQLFNQDGPGEGLNDPTPVAPVGGNLGTTLGQQRQYATLYAAEVWERALRSVVPVRVGVSFDPLPCGVLAGAHGTSSHTFPVAPSPRGLAGYRYYVANAEAVAGFAINDPASMDITITFNASNGTAACPGTVPQYLGFAPPPGNQSAVVPTTIHELAHGLGFATTTCVSSTGCGARLPGEYLGGLPSIFDFWAYDVALGKYWDGMTALERAFSSQNDPFLTWDGPATKRLTPTFLPTGNGVTNGRVRLFAPLPDHPGSSVNHFHEAAFPNLAMEPNADPDVFAETDLTPLFMWDIGWELRQRYRLYVTVVGQGGVGSGPAGIFCPNDCDELYGEGDTVTLTAAAFPGWTFSGWSGGCTGTGICKVTMHAEQRVAATFVQPNALRVFSDGFE